MYYYPRLVIFFCSQFARLRTVYSYVGTRTLRFLNVTVSDKPSWSLNCTQTIKPPNKTRVQKKKKRYLTIGSASKRFYIGNRKKIRTWNLSRWIVRNCLTFTTSFMRIANSSNWLSPPRCSEDVDKPILKENKIDIK